MRIDCSLYSVLDMSIKDMYSANGIMQAVKGVYVHDIFSTGGI